MTEEKQGETCCGLPIPKWVVSFVAIVVVVVILTSTVIGSYNTLVEKDVRVEQMRGNVQTALERRADLIPNFVSSVEGSANFEQQTLTKVIEARSQATLIQEKLKQPEISTEDLDKYNTELAGVIGRLLLVYEQYPTLQTTTQFRELEAQLTATENQVLSERQNYNAAVMDYKMSTRAFPTNIFARLFGFNENKWQQFSADQGKTEVPVVEFGNFK